MLGPVEDPRPYYRGASVCLVPAFLVTGVKTQILQAWATGCPVVTTEAAARTVRGVSDSDLVAADTPDDVARQLLRVLADEKLRRSISATGRVMVKKRHSPEDIAERMSKLIDETLATAP